MADLFDDVTQLRHYADGLQRLLAELMQAAPRQSNGADHSGAVRVVLGSDGLPAKFRVQADWERKLRPESFGVAVVQACQAATSERALEWSKALEQTGWQERAARLDAETSAKAVAAPASAPAAVPPAFRRAAPARRDDRLLENLAEEAIKMLDDASGMGALARAAPPLGVGANPDRTLTVRVAPNGQVSCQADRRWAAGQSGARLSADLNAALAQARQKLAEQQKAAAGSREDLLRRQQRLMAEIEAMSSEPEP